MEDILVLVRKRVAKESLSIEVLFGVDERVYVVGCWCSFEDVCGGVGLGFGLGGDDVR